MGLYWYGRQEEGKQGDGAERDRIVIVWKTGGGKNRKTEPKETVR